MEKKKLNTQELRTMYALTLILVPTILMAIASQYLLNSFVRIVAQAVILFLQAVVVHGMFLNKKD